MCQLTLCTVVVTLPCCPSLPPLAESSLSIVCCSRAVSPAQWRGTWCPSRRRGRGQWLPCGSKWHTTLEEPRRRWPPTRKPSQPSRLDFMHGVCSSLPFLHLHSPLPPLSHLPILPSSHPHPHLSSQSSSNGWQKVEYLLEFGEWLLSSHHQKATAMAQVSASHSRTGRGWNTDQRTLLVTLSLSPSPSLSLSPPLHCCSFRMLSTLSCVWSHLLQGKVHTPCVSLCTGPDQWWIVGGRSDSRLRLTVLWPLLLLCSPSLS